MKMASINNIIYFIKSRKNSKSFVNYGKKVNSGKTYLKKKNFLKCHPLKEIIGSTLFYL